MDYLLSGLLTVLLALACPIGMGVMMWVMMRGNSSRPADSTPTSAGSARASRPTGEANEDDQLARLRARLREVEAQQATVAAQIARLSAEDRVAAARPHGAAEIHDGIRDDLEEVKR